MQHKYNSLYHDILLKIHKKANANYLLKQGIPNGIQKLEKSFYNIRKRFLKFSISKLKYPVFMNKNLK